MTNTLTPDQCGALGLCELPKGHEGLHSTSVERAADLDGTKGYMVFEGPNGELMRTPYRAVPSGNQRGPFLSMGSCTDGKRHRWCNHPSHLHCVVCGKYREPKYD